MQFIERNTPVQNISAIRANLNRIFGRTVQLATSRAEDSLETLFRIFLDDNEDEQLIDTVLARHDQLSLAASKLVIDADGSDTSVIVCNDVVIDGDTQLSYEVFAADGALDFWGEIDVVSGQASLDFSTLIPDQYLIRFARSEVGAFEDGYVEVEVV